ncbi:MAG: LapA family protein [Gloeomargarita sp. SKYBB_i_bin120]|nr:LapA family protein [Gloeomargarita sp. SKYG98]MCS7291358.1 LapA family protein [Gloeomargarita sp. SKYB120]MDW8176917.1 LapA family protein [Gloeomargarita sp. SKYBB_i_bin120]
MVQVNAVLIFAFCLALVLFSLQNMEPVTVHLVGSYSVNYPLAVELILAMGVGAVLAWLFGVWNQLQRWLIARRELWRRDQKIASLERDIEQYRQQLSLPSSVEETARS